MQDWYDSAARVRLMRDGDPQPISQFRINLLLSTKEDEFVMMTERGSDPGPELGELVNKGELSMDVTPPRPAEVRNGMLKSAYLAAALHLRRVPDVLSATEIRAELLGVLNARKRSDVVAGPRAQQLVFYRTGMAPFGPPLAVLRAVDRDEYLISLAGTVLVSWPFPEIDPTTRSVGLVPES